MSRLSQDQSLQLDSIRALSALVVLVGHTNQTLLLPTLKSGSVLVGFFTQLAVMVFFVLSGFLIGKSVCNNATNNDGFLLSQYVRDRAIRLYPPLVAAILIMAALYFLAPCVFPSGTHKLLSFPETRFVRPEFTLAAKDAIGALFFVNGFQTITPLVNGPLWSLPFEAWYYVLAAAIFVWPKRRLTAVSLVLATMAVTYKEGLFIMLAPIWFAGFGLAMLHHKAPEMKNRLFRPMFLALSLGTAASVALVVFADPLGNGIWLDRMNHFRLISGLWFACYLSLILGGEMTFTKLFHSHASYSYTLYVIHFPIMLFVLGATQPFIYGSITKSALVCIATIAAIIPISMAVARIFEHKQLIRSAIKFAIRDKSLNSRQQP